MPIEARRFGKSARCMEVTFKQRSTTIPDQAGSCRKRALHDRTLTGKMTGKKHGMLPEIEERSRIDWII
ncbi:hypothetical protein EB232_34665 (plasmid) [Mesorhizobium sp. NZP2077]|nr:hypothetical protein EB232_34665 [Mesorhizobium sp. NZP2077]